MNNIAVFIDLNKTNFNYEAFKDIFEKLHKYGKVIYGKLYNYSSSRHKEYERIIEKYDLETAPRRKTIYNAGDEDIVDIREVVDVLDIANSRTKIDTMFIITGTGNVVPLLKSLKMKNIFLIGAYDYTEKNNRDMCDENFDYNLSSKIIIKEPETKTEVKKDPAKKVVKEKAPKKASPKKASAKKTSEKKEEVKTSEKKTAAKKKTVKTEPKIEKKPALKATKTTKTTTKKAPAKKAEAKVEPKKEVKAEPVKKVKKAVKTPKVATVKKQEVKMPKESSASDEEQYYISVLENFAQRTSLLNFEYNEDIDQKVALLKDIESFVEEQKAIQYEKDDFNPEIMAVLRELSNLADDIRSTLDETQGDGDVFDY